MNLLVKKIGLALLPALFFACEDPTELGANLNPNTGALSVHYAEFPVSTAQLRSDSVYTSLRQLSGGNTFYAPYVGRTENSDFGALTATLYANLGLPTQILAIGTFARLDSVKLDVVWNKNVYGGNLLATQQFTVHQLTAPIGVTNKEVVNDSIDVYSYDYFTSNTKEVGQQIGQFSLSIASVANRLDADSTLRNASERRISVPIDQAIGQQLLNAFKTNEDGIKNSQQAFENYFKGIAIVPAQQNTFLTSLDLVSENEAANLRPGLTLYYTQGTEQKMIRLRFTPPSGLKVAYRSYPAYSALEVERSASPLAEASGTGHMRTFDPLDGRVYFQGLAGIYPIIDLSPFRDLLVKGIEADEKLVINRAIVDIDSVLIGGPGRQPVPQGFNLYFAENANGEYRRFPSTIQQGFERAQNPVYQSYTIGNNTVYYYHADIAYNLEQFLRTMDDKYLQAVVYPTDGQLSSPNRFVVRNDQVKLKVWYTIMKNSTN